MMEAHLSREAKSTNRLYVDFLWFCFLDCHQENKNSNAGSAYIPVSKKVPPEFPPVCRARILNTMILPNANVPPVPSHFQAIIRPLMAKNKKTVMIMRSPAIAILPFSKQSATKKNKNTATKSVPMILAIQRMVVTDPVDSDAVSLIFISNRSVELHAAPKLIS